MFFKTSSSWVAFISYHLAFIKVNWFLPLLLSKIRSSWMHIQFLTGQCFILNLFWEIFKIRSFKLIKLLHLLFKKHLHLAISKTLKWNQAEAFRTTSDRNEADPKVSNSTQVNYPPFSTQFLPVIAKPKLLRWTTCVQNFPVFIGHPVGAIKGNLREATSRLSAAW